MPTHTPPPQKVSKGARRTARGNRPFKKSRMNMGGVGLYGYYDGDAVGAEDGRPEYNSEAYRLSLVKSMICYYAHPNSAWERWSNEVNNKLIRRYVPKGANIDKFTITDIRRIENWMNNYPSRIL